MVILNYTYTNGTALKPTLRLAHILFGRDKYKVDASRKFDINKMQPASAEKPRVRIGVVSVSMMLKRE